MIDSVKYARLVEQAQLGDENCFSQLVELSTESLRGYVYRITLCHDLTEDIVQETLLEMFKIFGKLERSDRFWPWLCGIALNKVRHHYRSQRLRKTVSLSGTAGPEQPPAEEGLANLVGRELKQIVLNAMSQLKPRYREVLTMRCYEQMEYAQIAQLLGTSEFATRVLFYRAKKSLQKHLAHSGLGKGSLVMALVVFGKLTAPSEAAAAQLTVTAASTQVGLTAGLVGLVTSKTAVVSLTAAGLVAAGSMVAPTDQTTAGLDSKTLSPTRVMSPYPAAPSHTALEDYWYYFPDGPDQPAMMRLVKWLPDRKHSYCQWLQNDYANYFYDKHQNRIMISNHRRWQSDLAVLRLPTDNDALRDFISDVEGSAGGMEYVADQAAGLFVIARRDGSESRNISQVTRRYNILDEEFFQYDWPADTRLIDQRDDMHKRGWTYFRVTGRIGAEEVSGRGRIPFIYDTSAQFYPWLLLMIGDRLAIVDTPQAASLRTADGEILARFPRGSFFEGLSRPWMGLHTIDTVRRDAARRFLRFQTRYTPQNPTAQVHVQLPQGELIYTIDMENDLIDEIAFATGDGSPLARKEGFLRFSYLQQIDNTADDFDEPAGSSYGGSSREALGMLWLELLFRGTLVE